MVEEDGGDREQCGRITSRNGQKYHIMTASKWHKIENDGDPWQPTCWLQMAHNDDEELSKKSGEVQINALIYAMAPEAEHIFQSFKFGDGELDNNYDTVIAKFDKHFIPKRNVIHERGRLNQMVRRAGDTVEEFVRHLYEMQNTATSATKRMNTYVTVSFLEWPTENCLNACITFRCNIRGCHPCSSTVRTCQNTDVSSSVARYVIKPAGDSGQ